MESTISNPASIATSRTHPLLLVAAASVTVLSLAGAATLAGWLPGPAGHATEPARVASAAAQPPVAAPISIQQTVTVPQEKAKPVAKSSERPPISVRHTTPTTMVSAPMAPVRSEPQGSPFGTDEPRRVASPAPIYAGATPPRIICRDCGVVEAVNEVTVEPKGSGGGAVTGGIVGGIIGNQIGKGATRDIATLLGAVGGAYAGNHIEKSVKESKRYDVVVRFDDGSMRTFSSDSPPAWHSGDHVRLQNGLLTSGGGSSNASLGTI